MIRIVYIILFLSPLINGQEKKIKKWIEENQIDSVYNYLIDKKKSDVLSDAEYSYLIYSTLYKEKYKNGLAFTYEWQNRSIIRNDSARIIDALNYRSKLYYSIGEYDKSIAITQDLIAFYMRKNNYKKVIQNKLDLGLFYTEQKKFNKAKEIYESIEEDSIQNLNRLSTFYLNYSNILDGLGEHKKSLEYIFKNLEISKKKYQHELPLNYSNISTSLYKLEKYNDALIYLDSAMSSLTNYQNNWYKQLIYQNKFSVWTALKNSDSAFYYLQELRKLDKIALKEDLSEEMEALKMAYEKERELNRKVKESELSLAKKDKIRSWIISTFIIALLIVIAIFYYLRSKNNNQKIKNTELEINLLRSQMNPHFIFNTLASIQSLIRKDKKEESIQYLNHFAKLTRRILEGSRSKNVSLNSELELLKKYVEIQQFRKNNFDFEINISAEIEEIIDDIVLPTLTLQPFVENAIIHGTKNIDYRGKIKLNVDIKGKYLIIKIDDNGNGLQKELENIEHKSHATNITRERLSVLDNELKTKSKLIIKNKTLENGVVVLLKVPIILIN